MHVNVNGIPCILAGGVRETADATGTGTLSLRGARTVDGVTYRTVVAAIGSGNTSVFTARSGALFETFIGTVTAGTPAQLTRAQILESSNSNLAVSWAGQELDLILDAAAAVFHSLQNQIDTIPVTRTKTTVFTINGTLTTDADTVFAWVRIVGGGGAGGGAFATTGSTSAEGAGGGGGEYAEGFFTAAQLGASKTVSIGAGGTGVSAGTGNTGGTTNFGSGLLTAIGGSGGGAMGSSLGPESSAPGAGGTGGAGGFVRIAGGNGGVGTVRTFSGVGIRGQTAYGGASHLSGSVSATVTEGAGAGKLYGGGGTGASSATNAPARAGGAGAAGVCIVVEYLHV